MNELGNQLTLSGLGLNQWRKASILGRLVGFLANWHEGSWLLQWSEAIAALLISLVIILAPFVSNSLIGILLLAITGFWVLLTVADSSKEGMTSIHLLVLLYWAISLVAVAFSPLKLAAFSGWVKLTLYLVMFALSARVLRSPKIRSWVMTIFLLTSLVVSAYGVRQELIGVEPLATWNDPTSVLAQDTRVYSYLGNPNLLAGYLIPAVAFSLAALLVWPSRAQKALALGMVLINCACLYFTDSRGGWLGLVVLGATFLLGLRYWWKEDLPPFWRRWLLPIIFGVFSLLIVMATLFLEPLRLRLLSIFSWRGDSSNNFRINVWRAGLEMIGDRPLIGMGPGNEVFNQIYPNYMQTKFTALSAYSIFLEIAIETGLIGLTCFLWLVAVTISQGIGQLISFRQQDNRQGLWMIASVAALAGMLTHGLVDTVWYRPQINTIWWLTVAMVAGQLCTLTATHSRGELPTSQTSP
jgi:putative inorganic carbon (HCO3(-)) transporter